MLLLIRYGEIHLKGLNRPQFERLQKQAIQRAMRRFEGVQVKKGQGRFYVTDIEEAQMPAVISAVKKVFGLHSMSPAIEIEKDMDVMQREMLELTRSFMQSKGLQTATFRVEAKRGDKRFPLNSQQIAAQIGGYILENQPGLSVDLHEPDFRVYIEVREQCYGYVDIIPGAGGMPQRSSGRAMLLLSGGIDSPVAGYMIARRGVELHAVHYHSFPYTSEASKQKVIDLARLLSAWTGPIRLHIVHFTDIQTQIHEKCPPEMLVILMRRFMMRIAQALAEQNGALALVTGENIAQVASQTLESMYVTNEVVSMPVFRPLAGLDKADIMDIARDIGTYETSILPHEDCCTVFVPKHPVIKPKLEKVEMAEAPLDIETLVQAALGNVETIVIE